LGNIRSLTSRDNPAVKALRALAADAREIRRQGRTLLDGPHLVDVYVRRCGMPESVVVSASGIANTEVCELLAGISDAEVLQIPDGLFREVSGGGTPVGVLAVIAIPDAPVGPIEGSCVMLDAVQDAGNVGTILRTAAAAGIQDVVLGRGCAGAWTPRVLRAAQGAHFSLRLRDQADLQETLADFRGTSVAAVATGGRSLFDLDVAGNVAWIFGNEGNGVDAAIAALATLRATIPLSHETESLNVAAAAAICLFEGVRQRRCQEGRN
jgi:RNA methyltransferase, TrmH family